MDEFPQVVEGLKIAHLDVHYREAKYLVQMPDGSRFMASHLLAQMLFLMDGKHSIENIASILSRRIGRRLGAAMVESVLRERLIPEGIVISELGRATASRSASPLSLLVRIDLLGPDHLRAIARPLQHLYAPWAARILLALVVICHAAAYWLMSVSHFSLDARQLSGQMYLIVYAILMLSIWVHELGHIAACRRFKCECGPLGIGLYTIFPVFYVDISAAWELPRTQRAVVSAGGMYFQSVFAILLALAFWLTGDKLLGWALVAVDVGIARNLNPFFKFDGYWLLSDWIGIPNLHQQVGARLIRFLRGAQDWRQGDLPNARATRILAVYAVGILAFGTLFVSFLARMVGDLVRTYPLLLIETARSLTASIRAGQVLQGLDLILQVIWPTIIIAGLIIMVWRICSLAAGAIADPRK